MRAPSVVIEPREARVFASSLSWFRNYTNLGKCEERLRRLLGEFRFGTARDGLVQLGLLSEAGGKG